MEEDRKNKSELFEDVDDWLKSDWGSLTREPSFEEKEAAENRENTAEFEPTYESGIELLGQLAEKFSTEPNQDYSDADRLMIAEMYSDAERYAREDENKNADAAARALRMRLADANNALMLADKYQLSQGQIEDAFAKRRNAERALDEYMSAYGGTTAEETVESTIVEEAPNDVAEEKFAGLELPGDVIE